MKQIIFRGHKFNHGDKITFRNPALIHGTHTGRISVQHSKRFYICTDLDYMAGDPAQDKLGHKYSWAVEIDADGESITKREKHSLCIYPFIDIEYSTSTISKRMNYFLFEKFPQFHRIFIYKLGICDNMIITDEKDGFVTLTEQVKENPKVIKIKLGRLVRRLANALNQKIEDKIEITDDVIEKLHNSWISINADLNYKLLKGDEIMVGYDSSTYPDSTGGSIRSCMINRNKEKYDLYTKNPEQISLALFYFDDKIAGRTILWKCTDGKTYHDRIYYTKDWISVCITDTLKSIGIESAREIKNLESKLDNIQFQYYPYLDTFKVDKENKIVRNYTKTI
jgi:hypothetical protein